MFTERVNEACINNAFSGATMTAMDAVHPSAMRLLACAQSATASDRPARRVLDFASLGARMGVSKQTITNWKRRGVSREGALTAERLFACSPAHIFATDEVSYTPSNAGVHKHPVAHEVIPRYVTVTPTVIGWGDLNVTRLPQEFQTVMPDAAMAPLIPMGARIIFVTDATAAPGDVVLLVDAAGSFMVREFRQLTPGRWQAFAHNPAFLPLDFDTAKLRVVAVFDGMRGRRAQV